MTYCKHLKAKISVKCCNNQPKMQDKIYKYMYHDNKDTEEMRYY